MLGSASVTTLSPSMTMLLPVIEAAMMSMFGEIAGRRMWTFYAQCNQKIQRARIDF